MGELGLRWISLAVVMAPASGCEGIDGLIQAEMHLISIDVTPPPLKACRRALPRMKRLHVFCRRGVKGVE